jgi:hypothetical protein
MLVRRTLLKLVPAVAAASLIETFTQSALAQATPGQGGNSQPESMPAYTPASPKVAAGVVDVEQLLLLMDTDKNGKISRKEFMDFMAAEFDRLDVDKNGELDVKELEKSQLTTSHHGGTHR